MKESYSLCFTSHDEVMFRDEADHGMFINVMAVEAYRTETEILSDAEMSNHVHVNAFSRQPMVFAGRTRMAYTKYFNAKYGRKGRMGEKGTYVLKVDGFNHQLVLNNYIFRNGLHHCAAATAFGYPFSSIREMFSADLGWERPPAVYKSRADIASFLPRFAEFPDSYQRGGDGVFLRRSFMEIRQVELFYVSPRNFLYQMNRLTDDSWTQEQTKDRTGRPITLADVEPGLDEKSIAQLLDNEYGRNFNRGRMQDMDVCRLIDREILPGYGVPSIYFLSDTQKRRIAGMLKFEFRLPEKQICRCLALRP